MEAEVAEYGMRTCIRRPSISSNKALTNALFSSMSSSTSSRSSTSSSSMTSVKLLTRVFSFVVLTFQDFEQSLALTPWFSHRDGDLPTMLLTRS